MGPHISGKSRLVKYYSIWPDDIESLIVASDTIRSWSTGSVGLHVWRKFQSKQTLFATVLQWSLLANKI